MYEACGRGGNFINKTIRRKIKKKERKKVRVGLKEREECK
jgi:hypothetical protein